MADIKYNLEARKTTMESADMEFVTRVADLANRELSHLWTYTPEDVVKILVALAYLCEKEGKNIDPQIMLQRLEWESPDGIGYRFEVWAQ